MSIKQLQLAIEPAFQQVWDRKSDAEKLMAKVLVGLAVLAAGNSGYHLMISTLDSSAQLAAVQRSLLAGVATGLGALALVFMKHMQPKALTQFITLAAGAMLAAALFSLLIPAVQMLPANQWSLALLAVAGGAALLWLMDELVPHEHAIARPHGPKAQPAARTAWLMVAAISLHNLPEGFAVGATAATTNAQANSTAFAIALQNVPEGLIVATALWSIGFSKPIAAGVALLSGLIEPIGAVLGAQLVDRIPEATPLALSFAAGAMLFVVANEMLPETRKLSSQVQRIGALSVSFGAMLLLNQLGA